MSEMSETFVAVSLRGQTVRFVKCKRIPQKRRSISSHFIFFFDRSDKV